MEKKTLIIPRPVNCPKKEKFVDELLKKYEVCVHCGFKGELYDSCPSCKRSTYEPELPERKVVIEEVDDSVIN